MQAAYELLTTLDAAQQLSVSKSTLNHEPGVIHISHSRRGPSAAAAGLGDSSGMREKGSLFLEAAHGHIAFVHANHVASLAVGCDIDVPVDLSTGVDVGTECHRA